MDPGLRPLVCLDEGTNYHGVALDVGPLCLVGHSGDGEGVGGVLGLSQQVLMGPLVPVLGQLRGVAGSRSLGVSRCRSFGMVETGSEVRHGDFAHLDLQIRGHLRPDVRNCLHVGGGGMVGGMEGLERCPWERPGPEPEIARRARVPTGEVGAESKPAGAAEKPCPAERKPSGASCRRSSWSSIRGVTSLSVWGGLVGVRRTRAIRKGEASAVQGSGRGN